MRGFAPFGFDPFFAFRILSFIGVARFGSASGATFGMRGVSLSMSLWEYKVFTSGRGGFASPVLMEKFLNDLGKDEWEIVAFQPQPENLLAFSGLARRSTQRDWSLQDAATAAAKTEAEKLRAEFAAKFEAATSTAPAAEEKPASFLGEKAGPDDGFRKPVDTSHDDDPEGAGDDEEKDEWDELAGEDELPTFFDALKPHMRRNQRGPGMSVGVDHLARKWGLAEEDIKGALVECGLQIPADENAKPVYVEFDGDLFWVNINRRGEVWINTREKPRPVFRVVQATSVAPDTAADESASAPEERGGRPAEAAAPDRKHRSPEKKSAPQAAAAAPLPSGPALLEKIRPFMRRNRRGPGGSGSTSFLARALKCREADLVTGFAALGLVVPATPTEKPAEVEIGGDIWWVNQDARGGVWINGREKSAGADRQGAAPPPEPAESSPSSETAAFDAAGASAPHAPAAPIEPAETAAVPAPPSSDSAAGSSASPLTAVRLLLKPTRTGGVAGKVDRLAEELGKSPDALVAALVGVGLKTPEKTREKPVFVEHAGEIFWFNKNVRDELWLNAKASKFAGATATKDAEGEGGAEGEKKPSRRGSRSRKKAD
jgi:hypothetical protein